MVDAAPESQEPSASEEEQEPAPAWFVVLVALLLLLLIVGPGLAARGLGASWGEACLAIPGALVVGAVLALGVGGNWIELGVASGMVLAVGGVALSSTGDTPEVALRAVVAGSVLVPAGIAFLVGWLAVLAGR